MLICYLFRSYSCLAVGAVWYFRGKDMEEYRNEQIFFHFFFDFNKKDFRGTLQILRKSLHCRVSMTLVRKISGFGLLLSLGEGNVDVGADVVRTEEGIETVLSEDAVYVVVDA